MNLAKKLKVLKCVEFWETLGYVNHDNTITVEYKILNVLKFYVNLFFLQDYHQENANINSDDCSLVIHVKVSLITDFWALQ